MVDISVIIATYNRSRELGDTLRSLQGQVVPEGGNPEILIVDNNSKDDTKAVVESFQPVFGGRLKYLFEPRQGQPYAHNRGIREAQGGIIVLTDDDCTFDKDYLVQICRAFTEAGPDIGFIGGRVLPEWTGCVKPEWFADLKPGWWFREFFWGPLAVLDYGEEPFFIRPEDTGTDGLRLFYGANMAVRKELFQEHGLFDERRTITQDTEIQLRFLKGKETGYYAPDVKVCHKIPAGRLTPGYYYRWYFRRGALLETGPEYAGKFYHPLGIQWSLIAETTKLLAGSVFSPTLTEKIYRRGHGLFNLGRMVQIAKKNIV